MRSPRARWGGVQRAVCVSDGSTKLLKVLESGIELCLQVGQPSGKVYRCGQRLIIGGKKSPTGQFSALAIAASREAPTRLKPFWYFSIC